MFELRHCLFTLLGLSIPGLAIMGCSPPPDEADPETPVDPTSTNPSPAPDTPTPSPVASAPLPESPCDTTAVVLRLDAGVVGPESCQNLDPINLELEALDLEALHIHDCDVLQALWTDEAFESADELLTALGITVLTQTRNGRDLLAQDLHRLAELGFTELEYDCPVSSAAGPHPPARSELARGSLQDYEPGSGWNAVETGLGGPGGVLSFLPPVAPPRIVVGVVDSGIDPDSPPPARISPVGWSYELDLGVPPTDGPWRIDGSGHGTAVANLIAEFSGGQAELVSIKVLDENGRGNQSTLARGILKGTIELGVQVLNLSLAHPFREDTQYGGAKRFLLEPLALASIRGVQVVAASGNTCEIPGVQCERFIPAAIRTIGMADDYPPINMTSVTGVNPGGDISNQAAACEVHVAAPSEHICTWTGSALEYPHYQRVSGTSFAAAEFTGALALFASYFGGGAPANLIAIRQVLVHTSNEGRLDYCRAWNALAPPESQSCTGWSLETEPSEAACASASAPVPLSHVYSLREDGIELEGYPGSTGYDTRTAAGQGCDGTWCSGVSSAPATPICSSCEYCLAPDGMSFQLRLQVTSEANRFSLHQLRLRTSTGDYHYFALPELAQAGGETLEYRGNLGSLGTVDDVLEAYLLAQDSRNKWTGVPLMRGSCQNP